MRKKTIIHGCDKRPSYFFIKGWIKILDGLVSIFTLGFYWSQFEYEFSIKYGMNRNK
jgi:hypothetical protein